MQLRWLIEKAPAVTAEQVRMYRDSHCCTMMEAKKALLGKQKAPVLQYQPEQHLGRNYWVDVPIEYVEGEK